MFCEAMMRFTQKTYPVLLNQAMMMSHVYRGSPDLFHNQANSSFFVTIID